MPESANGHDARELSGSPGIEQFRPRLLQADGAFHY